MSPVAIPLGPFDLIRPLGHGGMAEVWEGVHRSQGVPVAFKVLVGRGARTPSFRAAFRNEARAVACLDHPNIARVFDHGEITPEVERGTEGRLHAGDPYLVMELATGGALSPLCGRAPWPTARLVLLALLDAMAHAHARGVIHRDLKPDNVLLVRPGASIDQDPRSLLDLARLDPRSVEIKLSDFGLAVAVDHARDEEGGSADAAGTPAYMAPEQVEGRWRDYGPWTDLYGLGCLAWALVSGRAPFAGLGVMEQVEAHRRRSLPDLVPGPDCRPPRGFEDWVRRLLAKDPVDRFRWAADASWALQHLSGPEEEVIGTFSFILDLPPQEARAGATLNLSEVSLARVTWAELGAELDDADHGLDRAPPRPAVWSASRASARPLPESWRTLPTGAGRRLQGAGLGLFRLRAPPLVGREAERDLLWRVLREVHETGHARVLVIEGPAGVGKSRLARWLCEQAHEVGAAAVLATSFSPDEGSSGLSLLVERALRLQGLSRTEVQARVEASLRMLGETSQEEAVALTELVFPATAADLAAGARVTRFESPLERASLVARFLGRSSAERPVIAWLDDAHRSHEALLLARHLLLSPEAASSPVLLVLTAQPEESGGVAEHAALLDEIAGLAGATHLRAGPLDPSHHLALVHEMLGLEDELAAMVAERAAGNPLFALQLLQDWVDRGWLEPGKGGFRLRPDARPDLPDTLYAVGERRLQTLLEGRPDSDGVALELAAVLGHEVDGAEWGAAVVRLGANPPLDLVDVLVRDGLAEVHEADQDGGFRFVQGVLRESLLRRASEAGRLAELHRICADVLTEQADPGEAPADREVRAMRLGRHNRASGRVADAVEPLLQGAQGRVVAGDLGTARALLRSAEEAATEAGLPEDDRRWGRLWHQQGDLAMREGRADESRAWFQHLDEASRAWGWDEMLVQALAGLAWVAQDTGDLDGSGRHLSEAVAVAERLDDARLSADCARFQARLFIRQGAIDAAMEAGRRALVAYEVLGDHLGEGHTLALLSDCANWSGRADEAVEFASRGMAAYERVGSRWGMANTANTLGEIARMRGRPDEAIGHYRVSLGLYRAIGSGQSVIPYANVGLSLLESGQPARARPILTAALEFARERGLKLLVVSLHIALLGPAADARDWHGFDHHLERARHMLAETGAVDVDNARMASIAGSLARAAGDLDRAASALRIAHRQWEALGRGAEAETARAQLAELGAAEGRGA